MAYRLTLFTTLFCISRLAGISVPADSIPYDTMLLKYLPEITVVGKNSRSDIQQIPEIVGTNIYAGKKSALVKIENVQGNVVTNTMRQVLAKVPGIHIWESDGSGIQIGIAARGLSPNRSWEFNVRQNGYDIAADPFGYPEAYYNPQLQSVQQIEIVRGHGALQYGPQFGGMVNYILKNGSNISKPLEVETQQTVGSNGLFNSFNAIGGKTNQLHYYTFFDYRQADGWRENSRYRTGSAFGTLTYKFAQKHSITAEIMRWNMLSQQPGGLTDTQFGQNARQSFRSRNWFNLDWTTAALMATFQFSETDRLHVKAFGITGDRNSVGFMPSAGMVAPDTINAKTLQYASRTIDIDQYHNYGLEARYLDTYRFFNMENTLSAGLRLYTGRTDRFRGGKGSTAGDYDIALAEGTWAGDIDYRSRNAALFLENIFRITDALYLIPGVRYEYLKGAASGYNGFNNGQPVVLNNQSRSRAFLLMGFGSEWHVTDRTEVYANISQAYRPIQFADLTTPPTTDEIDRDLQDAKGFNADLGYRGKVSDYLFFDISLYYLQYNNRVGTLRQQRADGSFYNFRTNVGDSRAKGIELLAEFSPVNALRKNIISWDVRFFASYSFNDARYDNFRVITQSGSSLQERNFKNNKVEGAPEHIARAGATATVKGFMLTLQYSYTSNMYSDANNTATPTTNGQNGLIPAYSVWDITASFAYKKRFNIKAGINNLTDERYFTRRAGGYPGPGILPADGRTAFLSVGYRF